MTRLLRILQKAGLLEFGIETELFLLKSYDFNSIENIYLPYLWSFIYNEKFKEGRILERALFMNIRI